MKKIILLLLILPFISFAQTPVPLFYEQIVTTSNTPFSTFAKLQISLRPGQLEITRPLIIVEGFDAGSILKPEEPYGDTSVTDFIRSIDRGDSFGLDQLTINNTPERYDLIYVNWSNGTEDIKKNSLVLQAVINWVNNNKVGTVKNVLLGQSMGGVIGRYTLAQMEQASPAQNHDVRLFIAHDAPLQGANTPLSIQYFSRHAYDLYVDTPISGTIENGIPSILNFIDLLTSSNLAIQFPSLTDALTIQDTPAALQLNYHYADINSNPTMEPHRIWQQEFESKGYPQLCRNVAISNGNECAVNHGFNPRDKFISLHDIHNPDFFGDFLHQAITPIIGDHFGDVELSILGTLPGASKYYFDFDLHSNPNTNDSNRQVYNGKIRYEKIFLYIVPISHTITNRSKTVGNTYLPFDTYSGGSIDIKKSIDDFAGYVPANIYINPQYGFIPVVSALDIKRNGGNVNQSDYLLKYAGGSVPYPNLSSAFDNFIVDFNSSNLTNNRHISFQTRNGNWLANELNIVTPNIVDCSFICSNATSIMGPASFCTTASFSTPVVSQLSYEWNIISGNSLATITSVNNSNTVTVTANPDASGYVTLELKISNLFCGSTTITKTIYVGKPNVPLYSAVSGPNFIPRGSSASYDVNPVSTATSYVWNIIREVTDEPCPTGATTPKFPDGSTANYSTNQPYVSINWGTCLGNYTVYCDAKNECGISGYRGRIVDVGKPEQNPCNTGYTMKLSPNPYVSGAVVLNIAANQLPCTYDPKTQQIGDNNPSTINVKINNLFGQEVFNNVFPFEETITIQNLSLPPGMYVVTLTTSAGQQMYEQMIVL